MKRGYWLAGIGIVIAGSAAALFLPSYLAKQSVDRLITSLPAGIEFTYAKTGYSLFSRTFTLSGAVLHLKDPAIIIEADEIAVQNGNPWLEKAIEKAQEDPDSAIGVTRIADGITIKNIHSSYKSIDFKTGLSQLDGPKFYLGELYRPLAPLKTDPSVSNGFLSSTPFRALLQKAAQQNLAAVFDKEELRDTTITIGQANSNIKLVTQIADMEVTGYDRGSQQSTTINNIMVGGTIAPENAVEISVQKFAAGPCDYREILAKLRDGDFLETLLEQSPDIHETIDKVGIKRNGADLLSIDAITIDSSMDGGVNSMKGDISKIVLDLSRTMKTGQPNILPQLGYNPAIFDASFSYQQNPSTGTLSFSDTRILLENGGTITMDGSIVGVTSEAPAKMKIAGFTLTYTDNSLMTRLLDYMSQKSGKSVDQIKAFYVQFLQTYENAHSGDPVVSAGAEALKTFVANPHQLVLSMRPQQPIGRDDLVGIDPQTVTRMMGFSLTAQ